MESAPQIFQPVSVTPGVSEVKEFARAPRTPILSPQAFTRAGMEELRFPVIVDKTGHPGPSNSKRCLGNDTPKVAEWTSCSAKIPHVSVYLRTCIFSSLISVGYDYKTCLPSAFMFLKIQPESDLICIHEVYFNSVYTKNILLGDPMSRRVLTDRFVRNAKPGFYCDAAMPTLNIRVLPSGSKQWVQRLFFRGKPHTLGLGGYPRVSLAKARELASNNRELVYMGGDPLALKKRQRTPTFAEAAETVISIHSAGWKDSSKSEDQWRASLRDYAMRKLGDCPVSDITTQDVMAVLLPIWNTKRETARRVRQRIGAVMKWAIAEGFRSDNPAGEAIGAALPKNNIVRTHQRALPFAKVGGALDRIRSSGAHPSTVLAFEFLVLTACRSGEVRHAQWSEINLGDKVWTLPASRMKTEREHRVPLSKQALNVLARACELADGTGLVFPSAAGRVLSDNTLSKLLRDLNIDAVPHGFRSTFRDWCGDSGQPREIAEAALAHVVRGVEGAYARSDLFERRRKLMAAWGRAIA